MADTIAVFETAPKIEQAVGVAEQCRPPIMGDGAANVAVDAFAALEATAEAIDAIRVVQIGRLLEAFGGDSEIHWNSAAILQTPTEADRPRRRFAAVQFVVSDCAAKIDRRKGPDGVLCHAGNRKLAIGTAALP
jgi:hypothetical protein